mgnify:FL=1
MKLNKIVMTCIMFVAILLAIPMMSKASNDEMVEVKVNATNYYEKAYEMLNAVNVERKNVGRKELQMDQELMEAAMVRAREIILGLEHTRLDDQMYTTVLPNRNIVAENILRRSKSFCASSNEWIYGIRFA